MNYLNNLKVILKGIFLINLFLLIFNTCACERLTEITIENRLNQNVMIYYTVVNPDGTTEESTNQGTIMANSTKTQSIILIKDDDIKRIEAKDPFGKIVFSSDYNRAKLEEINWKITISP